MANKDFQAELVWKEKYDKVDVGSKKPIDKISLPFQKVETIGESRQRTLLSDEDEKWINKIIWGDNKYVLASLINGDPSIGLESMKGKIKLIYIDPPFFTGSNMPVKIKIPNGGDLTKQPSIVEEVAYRNIWKDGLNSFCQWIYERLLMMKDLLSDDGSIFVRFDYHYSHYVKLILDEVFGRENFRNEIVLNRTLAKQPSKNSFTQQNESLFFYTKSEKNIFNQIKRKIEPQWYSLLHFPRIDERPRKIKGKLFYPPKNRRWALSQGNIDEFERQGKTRINNKLESCKK